MDTGGGGAIAKEKEDTGKADAAEDALKNAEIGDTEEGIGPPTDVERVRVDVGVYVCVRVCVCVCVCRRECARYRCQRL